MKKLVSAALACALAASCCSCGGKKSSSSEEEKKPSLFGKWYMSEETIKESYVDKEAPFTVEEAYVVFNEDGSIETFFSADASDYISLNDDGFTVYGQECEILGFDGMNLTAGTPEQVYATFCRDKASDDMYGRYSCVELEDALGGKATFNFESPGVSYLSIRQDGTYSYNEETGEVKSKLGDGYDSEEKTSSIVIEGDTLTQTGSNGEKAVYVRADR